MDSTESVEPMLRMEPLDRYERRFRAGRALFVVMGIIVAGLRGHFIPRWSVRATNRSVDGGLRPVHPGRAR
ncbi:hypothetical protein Q0Z83_022690 [Actinoplanes sichuanensis]|nr:hypothetical protein Q0Z83_022690 [Actinoplanes sichuanensis]